MRAAREVVLRLQAGAQREEVEAARARVAVIDAQIAVLEKGLADANVVAPVSGIVTQTLADAGEVVAPRVPLLVVTDLDHAWANLFVPEPLIPRVMLGRGGAPADDLPAALCAVVYSDDVVVAPATSTNLSGVNLGVVAFQVTSVDTAGGEWPPVVVTILDVSGVCGGALSAFAEAAETY